MLWIRLDHSMEEDVGVFRLQLEELFGPDSSRSMNFHQDNAADLRRAMHEIFGLESDETLSEDDVMLRTLQQQEMDELLSLEAAIRLQDEMERPRRRTPHSLFDAFRFVPPVLSGRRSTDDWLERQLEETSREEAQRRRLQRQEEEARRRREEHAARIREESSRTRRHGQDFAMNFFGFFINRMMSHIMPPPSLTRSQLDDLPTTVHKENSCNAEAAASSDVRCSICLADFIDGDQKRVLPCAHNFHLKCADKWLGMNPTCPVCRSKVQP
ncbi:E3 ubiquitin-protein ligase RNF6-like isoform X1 [Biomphalaria glabrata]|uniref:E3 ubiquitin-protein ligase RNF6-like isoform X1 n=2 Tax=Biomphalaria glabrata TaxID=6526 RepID=A0A9W3BJI7_BIOGL|nr:E3 ubiquitin-protein ligase RNF6-like isoform X1 [Biomphalaria glabrata]